MTVCQLLADIVEVLRVNHLDHEAMRAEMATKADLTREVGALRQEMATKADLTREVGALRQEMATKADLAEITIEIKKLGLDFETFRHDSRSLWMPSPS